MCGLLGGVYDMIWRDAGSSEVTRLAIVYAAATAANLGSNRLCLWKISRPILVMTGVIALLLVVASRFAWKGFREWFLSDRTPESMRRVLIVGAGEGGAIRGARLPAGPRDLSGAPVAFVDDDPVKREPARLRHPRAAGRGGGHPARWSSKKGIAEIIVAMPSVEGRPPGRDRLTLCKSTTLPHAHALRLRTRSASRTAAGIPRAEHVGLPLAPRGGAEYRSDPRIPGWQNRAGHRRRRQYRLGNLPAGRCDIGPETAS